MSNERSSRSRDKKSTQSSASPTFDFQAELKKFFADPENIRELQRPLMEEIQKLKMVVTEKDEKIALLEKECDGLNERCQTLDHAIVNLQGKCDELEQYTRRNSLRLSGVTEKDGEDCYDNTLSILNKHLSLSPPLALDDIDRLHRTGRTRTDGKPRQIIIKFTRYTQRQRVMERGRYFKNTPFYLNEDLTKHRNQLLFHARKAKRDKLIRDCWTTDGRIMVKGLDEKRHQIFRLTDLQMITMPPESGH